MRLSINLVAGGSYVKAGDELPADFILPEHLERFAIYEDEPPRVSRADPRFSLVEGQQGVLGTEDRLAKSAAANDYLEAEEEFVPSGVPRPKPTRQMTTTSEKIRRARLEERKKRR